MADALSYFFFVFVIAASVAAHAQEHQAAKLVQPALDEFYATLSGEQKARFNTLGRFAGP
jgi:ABC-type transporter MlaC component